MNVKFLKEVAQYIGTSKIQKELEFLSNKTEECPLVFPMVGEFSAGKTTLINALTDSKQLETATQPTTSTIYEIHFGCKKCCAEIYYTNRPKEDIDNISDLHNEEIADAAVVEVYDTSTKVPSSIVLVDTPGLSSPDPKHKQTLIDFLPEADGILLVSDINQPGLTKSLTDFIETMKLSKKRMYLILTKCDTKSQKEISEAIRYIKTKNGIRQCNIATVSAKDNNMKELLDLFTNIQHDKAGILEQVNKQRVINIAQHLLDSITTLEKASHSDDDLDNAIEEQERKLSNLNNSIQKLINSLSDDIGEITRKAERTFEDTISCKLETLTGCRGVNFDAEATSIINNSASIIVSNLCTDIQSLVRDATKSNTDIKFPSLENVDLSSFNIDGLTYNLNLNSLGHEYDGKIATGVKLLAAAAVVYGTTSVLKASAEGAKTATKNAASSAMSQYGAADLAVDATQFAIISKNANAQNQHSESKQPNRKEQIMQKYDTYEQQDQEIGQRMGTKGGIVESVVGLATDITMAKPQRRKAIHEYIDCTLMPVFKESLERNCKVLLGNIHKDLLNDATTTITEVKESLNSLKKEKQTQENDFRTKIKQLNDYSTTLNKEYLCGNF